MSDDSGDGSSSPPSSSSSSSSSATTPPTASASSSSSSTPFAPSSLPPEALHAQAVRFLTSLRHHSPNSSLESQKEFLRSKGLGEEAIEAALRDAKRPDNLTSSSTSEEQQELITRGGAAADGDISEQSAFDQAARAFDDPLHTPLPSIPSRNYPRSPLALYYEEQEARNGSAAGGDIEAAVRRQEKARRYEVLLGFFRTVSYLFTLGGALTGVAVLLYRSFILPRLVTTLGARSFLLRHHVGLWDNVLGSVRALKRGGAAGAGLAGGEAVVTRTKAKAKAEGEAQAPRKGGERRGSNGGGGLKKVQFADEVDGGQLEEHSSAESDPLLPRKVTQMGGSDGKEKTGSKSKEAGGAEGKGEKSDGGDAVGESGKSEAEKEEEEAKQQELEPIDVCAPIRQSLAALVQKLRQDRADDAAAAATAGTRSATVEDEDDGAESDGSASLEDEEEEDVEFDPFVEVNGNKDDKAKKRKAGGSSTKKTGGTASKAKKSTSTSTPATAPSSTTPSPLYTSLTTLNANLSARLIASSSAARSFGRHNTAFNFGVPASQQQQQNGAAAASASSGEEKTAELTAQIKAEIRSLKGLMLSRRNFPRANLGVLSAGGREA